MASREIVKYFLTIYMSKTNQSVVYFVVYPKKSKKSKCNDSMVVLLQKVTAYLFLALLFVIPFLAHLNDPELMFRLYIGFPPAYDGSAITLIYYFLLLGAYFDVMLIYFVVRGSAHSSYTFTAKLYMLFLGQSVSIYGIIVELFVISGGFHYGVTLFLIAAVIANIYYLKYIYIQCEKGIVF